MSNLKSDLMNGSSGIIPAASMPIMGMRMKLSNEGGLATIQFERDCRWLQFSKPDLIKWIQALANLANQLP